VSIACCQWPSERQRPLALRLHLQLPRGYGRTGVGMETGVEAYCRRFGPALEEWFEPWGLPYAAAAPDPELLEKINEHLFVLEQLNRWYEESPGTTKSERHAALEGIFADHPLARDVLWIARQVHTREYGGG
jgi:hypothetical protein